MIDLSVHVRGGVRAIVAIDQLLKQNVVHQTAAQGALLRVYVAQYVSQAILHPCACSHRQVGTNVLSPMRPCHQPVVPIFALLQNFGELLSIDQEHAQPGINRQVALDGYSRI